MHAKLNANFCIVQVLILSVQRIPKCNVLLHAYFPKKKRRTSCKRRGICRVLGKSLHEGGLHVGASKDSKICRLT